VAASSPRCNRSDVDERCRQRFSAAWGSQRRLGDVRSGHVGAVSPAESAAGIARSTRSEKLAFTIFVTWRPLSSDPRGAEYSRQPATDSSPAAAAALWLECSTRNTQTLVNFAAAALWLECSTRNTQTLVNFAGAAQEAGATRAALRALLSG
jgi:hypothetical protein